MSFLKDTFSSSLLATINPHFSVGFKCILKRMNVTAVNVMLLSYVMTAVCKTTVGAASTVN